MRPDILNPLFAEVEALKGVGPALAKPLERLGLDAGGRYRCSTCRPAGSSASAVDALDEADAGRIDHRRADRRSTIARAGRGPVPGLRRPTRAAITSRLTYFGTIRAGRRSSCRSASRGSSRAGSNATARSCRSSIPTMSCRRPKRRRCPTREPVYPLSEGLTNHRLGRARRAGAGARARACRMDRAEPARRSAAGRPGARRWRRAHADPRRRPRRASGSPMTSCSPTSSR